ncbi:hypothetical protein M8J75_015224 [Diaphorina citri]|nr:hypothetical protein M8J75_015224 [Diaphorina citri]
MENIMFRLPVKDQVGEACIAMALYKKKTVYTTVSSEEGRQILLTRFPNMFKTMSTILMTNKHSPFEFSSDKEVVSFVDDNVAYT